jgi:chromosome segregation ATPase
MTEALTAISAVAGTLTAIIVTIRSMMGHWFKLQMNLETERQKTAEKQLEAVEAEKKVYEMSVSQVVNEFNQLKIEVRRWRESAQKEIETIKGSLTELQVLILEFRSSKKELSEVIALFKDYKESTEKRLKAVEDFGKVIVK